MANSVIAQKFCTVLSHCLIADVCAEYIEIYIQGYSIAWVVAALKKTRGVGSNFSDTDESALSGGIAAREPGKVIDERKRKGEGENDRI